MNRQLGISRAALLLLLSLATAGIVAAWLTLRQPAPPELPPADIAVSEIPPFSLPDLAGTMRSIGEWNEKPLLLNFWATWCAPCRREMPMFQHYHEARNEELQVVGVAIDRRDDVERLVAEMGVQYPMLVGQGDAMAVAESFGLDFVGLPFTVFADPSGNILKAHIGEVHGEHIEEVLQAWQAVISGDLDLDQARAQLQSH
jgi:thiol-disulfide isomerase/thioredoxin